MWFDLLFCYWWTGDGGDLQRKVVRERETRCVG